MNRCPNCENVIASALAACPLCNLDPNEAPDGFYAVPKSEVKKPSGENICRSCDWRPVCQRPGTDFSKPNHRCMSTPVILASTGAVVARNDGCSVVFKRRTDMGAQ